MADKIGDLIVSKNNSAVIVQVTVAFDDGSEYLRERWKEKYLKYNKEQVLRAAKEFLGFRSCNVDTITVLPIVLGARGTILNHVQKGLTAIECSAIVTEIRKRALFGSVKVWKAFRGCFPVTGESASNLSAHD